MPSSGSRSDHKSPSRFRVSGASETVHTTTAASSPWRPPKKRSLRSPNGTEERTETRVGGAVERSKIGSSAVAIPAAQTHARAVEIGPSILRRAERIVACRITDRPITCGARRRGSDREDHSLRQMRKAALSTSRRRGVCAAEAARNSFNSPSGAGACYTAARDEVVRISPAEPEELTHSTESTHRRRASKSLRMRTA